MRVEFYSKINIESDYVIFLYIINTNSAIIFKLTYTCLYSEVYSCKKVQEFFLLQFKIIITDLTEMGFLSLEYFMFLFRVLILLISISKFYWLQILDKNIQRMGSVSRLWRRNEGFWSRRLQICILKSRVLSAQKLGNSCEIDGRNSKKVSHIHNQNCCSMFLWWCHLSFKWEICLKMLFF